MHSCIRSSHGSVRRTSATGAEPSRDRGRDHAVRRWFAIAVLAVAVVGFVSVGNASVAHDIVSSLRVKGSAAKTVTDSVIEVLGWERKHGTEAIVVSDPALPSEETD